MGDTMRRPLALSNPELRKLLFAQVPADFADWLDFVAIGALLAFSWNVEPIVFAVLAVSMGLPYLLLGPFAGVLVDRINIRAVLIWSNIGRGLFTASFFLAPDWVILMGLIAARSSVDTFFTPAKQSAIQALTRKAERTSANGLSHAINQASKIVAPAAGGGLLIWIAPQSVFLLNAAVSVLAALMLLRLRNLPRGASDAEEHPPGMFQEVRTGLRDVSIHPVLRPAILMVAASFFAMFFYDTLIAPLTRDLGFTQTHLGLALAAVGAGGVLSAVMLSYLPDLRRPFLWIAAGSFIGGSAVAFLGLTEMRDETISLIVFISLFGLLGVTSAMKVVPFRTIMQNSVPPNRIGRVTALSEAANTIALLFAPFIGAAIAAATSIGTAFVCGGAVMLLVAIKALTMRNHR